MKRICFLTASLLLLSALCSCRASTDGPPETGSSSPPSSSAQEEPTVPAYIEVQREGQLSQIPVEAVTSTAGNYIIAMDPEYFTFKPQDAVDLFSYEQWPGNRPVYYSISGYTGAYDPEKFLADVQAQYGQQYTSCTSKAVTVAGFMTTLVQLDYCKDAPAYNRHLYLIDCGATRYVIETEFTTEMYEGLYAIIRATINTFTPTA